MTKIKDALVEANPWWRKKFAVEFKDREIYRQLQKYMPYRQILALTGLRRVGKTTLMLKTADAAIEDGLPASNVVYFSFDEFKDIQIRDVIEEYEGIFRTPIREGKHLLLLDEIQKLDDWADQLKVVYDLYGKDVKVLISGSESLFIRRKSKESLAGRMFEFKVEPLSFKEFIAFKGAKYRPLDLYKRELWELFQEFTLSLGFPELVGVTDRDFIKKYVKESIVEKIIYKDIPERVGVKDVSVIASILNILMEDPGQMIDISGLAGEMNTSRQTISAYLSYLEDSFLIRKLYNFSRNRRKVERKLRKYYPTLISPGLLFKDDDQSRSKVFEWILVNQLNAEFFWRDPYKNEVDIVRADGGILPIEVKYGKLEFDGLLSFMKKFKVSKGCIISSKLEEEREFEGKHVSVIPAFKFLLK